MLVIDLGGDIGGKEGLKRIIEDGKTYRTCMIQEVKNIEERDIGEWSDYHPLNMRATGDAEYKRLFNTNTEV
ncbi:MAG: hypothetical protein PHX80_03790 [Candidatus Nanoarchaeia archaeon]|nr:hypothetical protein [Candidatus Nanoarchaeia archaeon]